MTFQQSALCYHADGGRRAAVRRADVADLKCCLHRRIGVAPNARADRLRWA